MPIGSNAPTPYGGQLDRCQVCGNKYHREELVRTQVDTMIAESENKFSYSSYDGSYWVCDAVDEGAIAFGNHLDEARTSLSNDNVITTVNGVQAWSGDGTMRTTVVSDSIDPLSYVLISAQVGALGSSTTPELDVSIGVTNSDGSSKEEIRSWNYKGARKVWASELASTLQDYGLGTGTGLFFYISVENDNEWWMDEFQLEIVSSSDTRPGVFLPTSGAAAEVLVDTPVSTTRIVCPGCFEHVFKRSQKFGRTKLPPTAAPVKSRNQEY